jgi:hypothetical protein
MSSSIAKSTSATRRGVTEQAAIDSGTRVLRLPTIRASSKRSPPRRNVSSCPTLASSLNW